MFGTVSKDILSRYVVTAVVDGRRPFHIKFALKVTYCLPKNADFDKFLLVPGSASAIRHSEKC